MCSLEVFCFISECLGIFQILSVIELQFSSVVCIYIYKETTLWFRSLKCGEMPSEWGTVPRACGPHVFSAVWLCYLLCPTKASQVTWGSHVFQVVYPSENCFLVRMFRLALTELSSWRKCPLSPLSKTVATSHVWLLNTGNISSWPEDRYFYFILL